MDILEDVCCFSIASIGVGTSSTRSTIAFTGRSPFVRRYALDYRSWNARVVGPLYYISSVLSKTQSWRGSQL